ncbi:hypothetical protein [Streptomyces canus]
MGRKFHLSYNVSGATGLMHRLGFTPQIVDSAGGGGG